LSRRVVFPLKLKILAIMAALLGGSISIYAIFALDLFKKDKSAYIYGNNRSTIESFHQQVDQLISGNFDKLHVLSLMPQAKIKKLLESYNSFYHLDYKSKLDRKDHFYNINAIEDENLSLSEYKNISKNYESRYRHKNISIHYENEFSFLKMSYVNVDNGVSVSAHISLNLLKQIASQFPQYSTYILQMDGEQFWNSIKTDNETFFNEIIEKKVEKAVVELGIQEPYIVAFKIDPKRKLIFVSKIKKSEAYKVNDYLVNKSKVFGIVILSLAGFIALLFSRSLTSPLESLYNLTIKFSKGEFGEKVLIKSRDEIGSLGESFNFMSGEIVRYMSEMEEKARLENEVKTAKYVQSNYFPAKEISLERSTLSSFYTPASECGGDWWGYMEFDNKLVLVIADATGHGVPAALLTATAHCCIENLKQMTSTNKDIVNSPARILEFMNKSILCLDGKLLMTAFCCLIDYDSNTLIYANASHNPPFHYSNPNGEEATKSHFSPLLGVVGPRLGHKTDGEYIDERISINDREKIILFTDGILESQNSDEKEYGQRRFFKSLIKNTLKENADFKKSIIDDAYEFYGKTPINDDITFVSVEIIKKTKKISIDINDDELKSEVTSMHDLPYSISTDECHSITTITDRMDNTGENCFLISSLSDEDNILKVLKTSSLNHLIGRNAKKMKLEIVNNLKQMFAPKGLSNYINCSKNIAHLVLSKNDFSKVNSILDKFNYDHCFQSPVDYLKIISNELLTNAIYHSGSGEDFIKRSQMDRNISPILSEEEAIVFTVGSDENYIAISVKDSTGRLKRSDIVNNLVRSFESKQHENKEGGAGLGLYLAYSYSNQFIVNTIDGKSSEVICIIDVNKRLKAYKERITSFHYFEQKGNT